MINTLFAKKLTGSLLAVACLMATSAPQARSNFQTRHIFVLPGTCIEFGEASATFNHNSLTLSSDNAAATAAAVVTPNIPNNGVVVTNFAMPQGTLSFTAVKSTPNEDNDYEIVAFYQFGSVVLQQGTLPDGTTNLSVNTVKPGKGNLLAVSFLYAGYQELGIVTVSNFRINNIPVSEFNLNHPQNCAPYVLLLEEPCEPQ